MICFRRLYSTIAVMFVILTAGCSGSGGGAGSVAALQQPVPTTPQSLKAPRDYTFASTVSPDLFICIPTITISGSAGCSSPVTNPTQWVEVLAVSFGNSQGYFIGGGGVISSGKTQFSSISLIKIADSTSPVVQQFLYSHRVISPYVRLIETHPSPNGPLPFVEIDLKNATIVSENLLGSSGFSVSESLSLNFTAMQYAFQSTTSANLTGPIYAHNWDITSSTADFNPNTILPPPGQPAAPASFTHRATGNHRILIPERLAQAVAADAKTASSDVQTILNGNYTELLTIPGMAGTSTLPGYANAFEIFDFSVGTQAAPGAGAPSASPLSYAKSLDLNSTAIWSLIARGVPYSGTTAELDLVDATTPTPRKVAYFRLGNPPYPESYTLAGSAGSPSSEQVGLFYTLLDFCVIPYTNGSAGSPVCHGYDYLKNKPI